MKPTSIKAARVAVRDSATTQRRDPLLKNLALIRPSLALSLFASLLMISGLHGQPKPEAPETPPPPRQEEKQQEKKDAEEKKDVVEQQLDEVSITATRVKRNTQDVPANITVIGKEKIDDAKMHNIQDALSGTPGIQVESKNGGYDSRLIIRGAGTKARYGIREIMVLLNGVPITDPDGFSKLDLLDPQQIEQIEVVKGPNSTLWGANAAGGVINIITKSPLTTKGGFAKIGGGSFGERSSAFSYASNVNNFLMYMVSGSYLASDSTWRERNKYSAYNAAFQPSFVFDDGTTWENYISYNKSDLQLPGTTDEVLFQDYKRTGDLTISKERKDILRYIDSRTQTLINAYTREDPWKYSGRYSDSAFFSSKVTKQIGNITLKPMVYGNRWTHNHPITGLINDGNSHVVGGDLQADWKHSHGTLTVGANGRTDRQEGRKYEYKDVTLSGSPSARRISAVNSDNKGDLASTSSDQTRLAGAYIQESFQPNKDWVIDLGARYDEILFNLNGNVDSYYDWSRGNYVDCRDGMTDCGQPVQYRQYHIRKIFEAASPRTGISYRIIKPLSIFGNAASGIQTPTASEISSNPDLKLVRSTNYEGGFKGRGKNWSFDMSSYVNMLENEVVPQLTPDSRTVYQNAGRTLKRGSEVEGSYLLTESFGVGAAYARMNYVYLDFMEVATDPVTRRNVEYDRGGKSLPYAPSYQEAAFVQYKAKTGFKARLQVETWGRYYLDTANSETYQGIKGITTMMIGYQIQDKLDFTMNVRNLTNRRYAVEVTKDPSRGNYYSVAPPRTISVSLSAKF